MIGDLGFGISHYVLQIPSPLKEVKVALTKVILC